MVIYILEMTKPIEYSDKMKTRIFVTVAVVLIVAVAIYYFSRRDEAIATIPVDQSASSPSPSEIAPVHPDESAILLDDLPVMNIDDDALEIALLNKKNELERQAEKEAIWAAPWQETFEFVTSNPPDIDRITQERPMVPGAFVEYLHWDLYLSKILSVLSDQNSPDYEAVRASVRDYCENTFYTLPVDFEPIGDFVPSVPHSGLAASMPYLLAQTDNGGDTLLIMIKMQQFQQRTNAEKYERDTGNKLDGRKVWSTVDFYVYSAGLVVLDNLVASNPTVSPEQHEGIVQYKEWKENQSEEDLYAGHDIEFVLKIMAKF
jgi:hypothetical protein